MASKQSQPEQNRIEYIIIPYCTVHLHYGSMARDDGIKWNGMEWNDVSE
jgi:hypothetical protein